MGDKAGAPMAATPSANATAAGAEPGALAATPASRMDAERVGTTEPGADEIASEKSRTAKKPVKKASTKKSVKNAKSTKAGKTPKAAAGVQPGVPTNLQ